MAQRMKDFNNPRCAGIAQKLKEVLSEKEMTVPDLAAAIDCSDSTIYTYLTQQRLPSILLLITICDALDISPDYLLGYLD